MIMTGIDYNSVRYNLTYAIRYLQVLYDDGKKAEKSESILSEYDYWISTLELIRNCVYECVDDYDGQINISYSIQEVHSEVTNYIYVIKKVSPKDLKLLDKVHNHLNAVEGLLNVRN